MRVEFRDLAIFGDEVDQGRDRRARAAGEQGAYFAFQHALFVALPNQGHPDIPEDLVHGIVTDLGLDLDQFTTDWADPAHAAAVQADSLGAQQARPDEHARVRHRHRVPGRRAAARGVPAGHRGAGRAPLLMLIGYGGTFLGGMAAILSPCAVLLLPAFFAYAFGDDRARLLTGLFYLGLLLALVPLGLGAARWGRW